MARRVVAGVLAVALAAVGTAVLVMYVRGAEERALAGEEVVDVLVVKEEVTRGTSGEDIGDHVATEQVPAKVRAHGGVEDLESLNGRVAAVDLVPGEQVVDSRFVDPAALQASRVDVPDGLQVVTVSLAPERTVGGQLSPGNNVGVIASFGGGAGDSGEGDEDDGGGGDGPTTHLVLHEILVTNVQGEPAGQGDDEQQRDSAPGGNLLVSLAVEAGDAEKVVFAAEHGSLWLTYQPDGATDAGTRIQTLEEIYR